MATLIRLRCKNQKLSYVSKPVIASGDHEVDSVSFELCEVWDGYLRTAVFYRNVDDVYHVFMGEGNECVIPHEVLRDPGIMYIGIFGVREGKTLTSNVLSCPITLGAITSEGKVPDPTPDVYAQILSLIQAGKIKGESAYDIAILNGFEGTEKEWLASLKGETGAPGVHVGTEAPTNGETVWIDTDEEIEEPPQIDVVAIVGQTVAVKAVDENGKPTEWQAVDFPKAAAPDLAANEGEPGFIKNRTHYIGRNGVVHKIPEKFIPADWLANKDNYGGAIEIIEDIAFTSAYHMFSQKWYPEVGFEWDVYWNNVKYTCSLVESGGEAFLGNRRLLGSSYPDTGEPFLFTGWALSNSHPEINALQKNTATAETVRLRVETHAYSVYDKMPEGYLPDCVVKSVNGISPDEKGNVEVKGGVDPEELTSAVESALAEAKASGEFDGKDGVTITRILNEVNEVTGVETNVIYFSDGQVIRIANGEPGTDGVGVSIRDIIHNETTGQHIITFSDGNQLTVSDGKDGADGEDGKDYVLTDADKAELAQMAADTVDVPTALKNPNALTINGTEYDGSSAVSMELAKEPLIGTTAEITPTQVAAAISEGRAVAIEHTDEAFGEIMFTSFACNDYVLFGSTILTDEAGVLVPTLLGILEDNSWISAMQQCATPSDIPTVLPNPSALTINGTSYDGSAAVSVNITEGLALLIGTTDEITPTQVAEAVTEGRPVRISHTDEFGVEYLFTSFNILDNLVIGEILVTAHYDNSGTPYATFPYLKGIMGDNERWMFDETLRMATVEGLPTTLPNPHKLTINGKVYDGSEEVTVNIEGGIDAEWVATSEIIGNNDIVIAEQTLSSGIWSKLQTKLVLGMTYEVYINDVCYLCVCYNHDDGGIYLGNGSLSDSTSIPHNNEPFCVYASSDSATSGFFYKTDALSYPLTLKVTGHSYVEYNKLPKEYLPDDIGGNIDVTAEVGQTIVVEEVDANGKPTKWRAADFQEKICGTEETVLVNEVAVEMDEEGWGDFTPAFEIINGTKYRVTINGVSHIITAADMNGMTAIADMTVMLAIFANGDGGVTVLYPALASQTVTLSVAELNITPIPTQYVTNAFPYYIEVTGSGSTDDPYVCSDTVANVTAIYNSGREIRVKHTEVGSNGAVVTVFMGLRFAATLEGAVAFGFVVAGMGAANNDCLFFHPQDDGTYLVNQSWGD